MYLSISLAKLLVNMRLCDHSSYSFCVLYSRWVILLPGTSACMCTWCWLHARWAWLKPASSRHFAWSDDKEAWGPTGLQGQGQTLVHQNNIGCVLIEAHASSAIKQPSAVPSSGCKTREGTRLQFIIKGHEETNKMFLMSSSNNSLHLESKAFVAGITITAIKILWD